MSDKEYRHARKPRFHGQPEFEKVDPVQLLYIEPDLEAGELDFTARKEVRRISISRRYHDSNSRFIRDPKHLATISIALIITHIFFKREILDPFRCKCRREVCAYLVILGDFWVRVPPVPMQLADDRSQIASTPQLLRLRNGLLEKLLHRIADERRNLLKRAIVKTLDGWPSHIGEVELFNTKVTHKTIVLPRSGWKR